MTKKSLKQRVEDLESLLTETRDYLIETRAALIEHIDMENRKRRT